MTPENSAASAGTARYNLLLLSVAGLGGLLYGIDVGIIAGALPYLEATTTLDPGQRSFIVAAVLLGSVVSTLFAGALADIFGRKRLMAASGLLFVASVPVIALSHGYAPLIAGRLLQGVSAGLIGVVVPLYLAECLGAAQRGKGTGIFQWLLTFGIVAAALIGWRLSVRVEDVRRLGDAARLLAFEDTAWRSIFWASLPPGVCFMVGSLFVSESPRWLFRRGDRAAAAAALRRSRAEAQVAVELEEMERTAASERALGADAARESLLRRKYVVPFILACVILACNQMTGINSIIGYSTSIFLQAGLSDLQAHGGYVILTAVNFIVTLGAVALVDRKGRKFLLSLGSAGIVVMLVGAGFAFRRTESRAIDCRTAVQALVGPDQTAKISFDPSSVRSLLSSAGPAGLALAGEPVTLEVIYSCGDFRAAANAVRSDDPTAATVSLSRGDCLPANRVIAFFSHPFANLDAARAAPLHIDNALISPIPSAASGWVTAAFLFGFMAFFAIGPGVCVWLALSELMPTRIRSNGMSIALLINQGVSTGIAASFLPAVGRYGYSTIFFTFAACTVVYFVAAAFILPETKGKTLEEIEACFE